MRSTQSKYSQPHLTVLPKPKPPQGTVRTLEPQYGILWEQVEGTLSRFNWEILESNMLFVKAHHPQAGYTIHISRMGDGTVIVNQDYAMLVISDLTDLEIIADLPQT